MSQSILASNAVAITEGYHQGGWTDGEYFYQAHITYKDSGDENNNKVIILKYDMKTGKLVKQSDELSLNHANDVTYNSRMGYLVVCHSRYAPKKISLIDANTLKLIETKEVEMAIRGIDYNAIRDCYAVAWETTEGEHWISILNSDFETIANYEVSTDPRVLTDATIAQGMCSDDDYLYYLYYNEENYRHAITVFDWEGNYKTGIEFTMSGIEPENISIVDGEIYCMAAREVYRLSFD